MLVKNWMSRPVVTVREEDSMEDVMRLMKKRTIRILPVLKKGHLTGIVTDRDIKRASASDATTLDIWELHDLISKIKVKNIMTREPITVPNDYTIEETAQLLMEHKISGVPVMNPQDEIEGIITQTDLFKLIISFTSVGINCVRLALQLEDRSGSIKTVTDMIREKGGRLASIMTSYDQAPAGFRNVYIRAYSIDEESLNQIRNILPKKVKVLYAIGQWENKRYVFKE